MSWARLSPAEREKLACAMKMDFGRPVTAYLTNAMFVAVDELMHKAMGMMNGELNAQYSNFTEGSARRNFQELRSLISIVLYLCSSEPDIDPARMPNSTTRELPFRKGKKGKFPQCPAYDFPRMNPFDSPMATTISIALSNVRSRFTLDGLWLLSCSLISEGQTRFRQLLSGLPLVDEWGEVSSLPPPKGAQVRVDNAVDTGSALNLYWQLALLKLVNIY